jgi:hypothetical protein
MSCPVCASSNQSEFPAEINIHFSGLKNLDRHSVLIFPKILVCLCCGLAEFTIPENELPNLAKGAES